VGKFFKTLAKLARSAKLASSSVFSLAKSENNWPKIKKELVRGKKNPRQTGECVYIFTHQS
jgi:hypothetical protein